MRHHRQRAGSVINDALRSRRPILSVHRGLQTTFVSIALGLSVSVSASTVLSEDRVMPSAKLATPYPQLRAATSYRIAMSPHPGDEKLDREIRNVQRRISEAHDPLAYLERLGWLYVAKARTSHDQGFYKVAEQCALAMEVADSNSAAAKLLRGHVFISFHRFAEAETIGRELVAQRALSFDYGLLGDALTEQGRLSEAVEAYQSMVDLRPDMQSYSRVAHMRWLKGDLDGAIEVARLAAQAAGPYDPELASWSFSRLAVYYFQAGSIADAKVACDSALKFSPDYPAALLLKSRMLLAANRTAEAVESVQRSADKNPLPEFQWALADTLRAAGRSDEATKVETELRQTGAQNDPRTFALFLATRGEQTDLAIQLARRELKDRADIFTHDALAWALVSAGRLDEAWLHMEKALAESTVDARIYTHAGVLAANLGRPIDAESWLSKARTLAHMLLPSERQQLSATSTALERAHDTWDATPKGMQTVPTSEDHLANTSLTNENNGK
jgi:tetratricopeptide (TPR) repeat protein